MAEWIYCATSGQVGAAATQSLLRSHHAIWCKPPNLPPKWDVTDKRPGDRLWLVWQDVAGRVFLLGGGRLEANAQPRFNTMLLWTNTDNPGVRDEAIRLGYEGPLNMSFLRLTALGWPSDEVGGVTSPYALPDLGPYAAAWNEATADDVATVGRLAPVT